MGINLKGNLKHPFESAEELQGEVVRMTNPTDEEITALYNQGYEVSPEDAKDGEHGELGSEVMVFRKQKI